MALGPGPRFCAVGRVQKAEEVEGWIGMGQEGVKEDGGGGKRAEPSQGSLKHTWGMSKGRDHLSFSF